MKQPKRRWARFMAKLKRTFFTYCPRCHHWFGGHEPHKRYVVIDGIHYRYVCGGCAIKE